MARLTLSVRKTTNLVYEDMRGLSGRGSTKFIPLTTNPGISGVTFVRGNFPLYETFFQSGLLDSTGTPLVVPALNIPVMGQIEYKGFNGVYGSPSTITNDSNVYFVILYDGGDSSKWIELLIKGDTFNAVGTGSYNLTVTSSQNDLFGPMYNAELGKSFVEYRCLALLNHDVTSLTGATIHFPPLAIWNLPSAYIASGSPTIAMSDTAYETWPRTGYMKNQTSGEILAYSTPGQSDYTAIDITRRGLRNTDPQQGLINDVMEYVYPYRVGFGSVVESVPHYNQKPDSVVFSYPDNSSKLSLPTVVAGGELLIWLEATLEISQISFTGATTLAGALRIEYT